MWILNILKKIKDKYYDIIDDIMEFWMTIILLEENNLFCRKKILKIRY